MRRRRNPLEDSAAFTRLKELAEDYQRLQGREQNAYAAMLDEATTLVRDGRIIAVVSRICGVDSSNLIRLAGAARAKKAPEDLPAFARLKKLAAADRKTTTPSTHQAMRAEAAALARRGWEEGRYGWTPAVARVTGISRPSIARLADVVGKVPDDAPVFDRLKELADDHRTKRAELVDSGVEEAMVAEAVALARQGRRDGIHGQTAAAARVIDRSREHIARLARDDTGEEDDAGLEDEQPSTYRAA